MKAFSVALLAILFGTSPAYSQTTNSDCKVEMLITIASAANSYEETGSSVLQLIKKSDSPFGLFSKRLEEFVLRLTHGGLCSTALNGKGVTVHLKFVTVAMTGVDIFLERSIEYLSSLGQPYGSVKINTVTSRLEIEVVWSPRQILREHYVRESESAEPKTLALPFDGRKYAEFSRRYPRIREAISNGSYDAVKLDGVSKELIYLFSASGRNSVIPFSSSVASTISRMNRSSWRSYAELIELMINQSVDAAGRNPARRAMHRAELDTEKMFLDDSWKK